MKAEDLPAIVGTELERRKYFVRMDVLDQTLSLVKIRLYISPDLFVQIHRNDQYQTALVHESRINPTHCASAKRFHVLSRRL
ncbi:MAG: hypothetical protein IT315_07520 [Anaerolineales bacterium]|nr:hypothetical protein [Anaerolineales bacterium]